MPTYFWTDQEIELLGQIYSDSSISKESLKERFRRAWAAINMKARRLGLARPFDGSWSSEEIDQLRRIYPDQRVPLMEITEHLGRSRRAIMNMAYERDEEIVRAFAQAVAPGAAIHRNRNAISIRIGSKHMAQDLAKYGVVPKKTETLEWPHTLPEAYAMPFILGYFDGDGCFYRSHKPSRNDWTWYLLGTAPFLSAVPERLEAQAQVQLRDLSRYQ